jgi:hypothetical protein
MKTWTCLCWISLLEPMLCFASGTISSQFSCLSYPANATCIPRQMMLNSIAGQSQYMYILPRRTGDAGLCDSSCATSFPVSAEIGGINATVEFQASTGFILLTWKEPNTCKIAGTTELRAFVAGEEISNSPLTISVSPGSESLANLMIYGAGSVGGQVNTNISL